MGRRCPECKARPNDSHKPGCLYAPHGVYRFSALATYNAERARGLLHSEEWMERMAEEQRVFDFLHGHPQPT